MIGPFKAERSADWLPDCVLCLNAALYVAVLSDQEGHSDKPVAFCRLELKHWTHQQLATSICYCPPSACLKFAAFYCSHQSKFPGFCLKYQVPGLQFADIRLVICLRCLLFRNHQQFPGSNLGPFGVDMSSSPSLAPTPPAQPPVLEEIAQNLVSNVRKVCSLEETKMEMAFEMEELLGTRHWSGGPFLMFVFVFEL